MHIVQIANFVTPTSGGQRFALESLATQYVNQGNTCTLITPGASATSHGDGRRGYVSLKGIRVPFSGGYRAIIRKKALQNALKELQPDIVELSDKTTLSWVPQWCHEAGIPCVLFSHERASDVVSERFPKWLPVSPMFRRWATKIDKHVDVIICASQYSADEYLRVRERVRIIPLGVDHSVFHHYDTSNILGATPTVLFAGRLSYEKRPHVALLAARELNLRGVKARFVIAGDGPMRKKLESMAHGLDVTFLGRISERQELAMLMSSSTVAISPSPLETFGLSILEILACGTPVVVANSGAGMEIVDSGCGDVAEPTGTAMADAIEKVLSQHSPTIRRNCVSRASHYSWSASAASMVWLYESLLSQHHRMAA
jgi:alpha-1,6-mannosyltransferase